MDEAIRLLEHQESTVDELRRHAFHPAMLPLIDEIEANIRENKRRLEEHKRQPGDWIFV